MTIEQRGRFIMSSRPLLAVLLSCMAWCGDLQGAGEIDFARDVLTLFRRSCWECHGPNKQEGGLRLDRGEAALQGGDSGPAIVPGRSQDSELIRRISLPRHDSEVMPSLGEPLSSRQVDLIRQWIDGGASWPSDATLGRHWAYQPPRRPPLPSVANLAWPQTAVDYFVLARLEEEGLAPAPEADRATLLRRVYLALVGLPPTPAEVDAFVRDEHPRAYESVVDRLLASDQFGVRWARPWLDYARYADSHGFQRDDFRDLWPYRDWVVQAINSDVPFDQFTIEQLAGDLLPKATESQQIATGFLRSAPTNVEAGSDPEETRVNQVFDRVNTLGMVWLGTSLECAQCHDHKYDPFTMRDYYGLFAFFNQSEIEADRSNPKVPGSIRFLGPEMELQDAGLVAQREELRGKLAELDKSLEELRSGYGLQNLAWEQQLREAVATRPQEHVLDISDFDSLGGATHERLLDQSILLSGEAPDHDTYSFAVTTRLAGIRGFKLEVLTDPSLPGQGPGRGDAQRPNIVLSEIQVTSATLTDSAVEEAVELARAVADYQQPKFAAAAAIDGNPKTGWAIGPKFHASHWIQVETTVPVGSASGAVFRFKLVQEHGRSLTIGRLRLLAVTGDSSGASVPSDVAQAVETPADQRTAEQHKLLAEYRQKHDPQYQRLAARRQQLQAELGRLKLPTTQVMREVAAPRANFLMQRGNFRTPGEPVVPAVPAVLASRQPASGTRLDLAQWLVSEQNALFERVTVNRWWQELFGRGLVSTPEDFGVKGELPTHPELLDWLAVEFRESGLSFKSVLRTMVLSATFRQTSQASPGVRARDDQNLLYGRGPRFRLDAETIRDNALAIAGLVSLRTGGAPIRPFQPDGLWVKVGGQRYEYEVSPGDEAYRRGLYVVWKRAAPYPSFVNFDANSRLACRLRRPRSNTPLQALTLLNDPVYVEAAAAFAGRVLTEVPDGTDDERIRYAHRLAVAREPRDSEVGVLATLLAAQRQAAAENVSATKALATRWQPAVAVGAAEFTAWYAVCAALLNLDETITIP